MCILLKRMPIERKTFSTEVGGKTLTLEISSLAEQTNAAILGHYGKTSVLTTVVMSDKDAAVDYMPLKVDYEEKFYAAGKVIGSRFIRREGRPSEDAILTGRLVDRTIRPLFDSRLRREVQVVVTVLQYDEENDPDFVGLLTTSTALSISDVPWQGPVGGVRVAKIGGEFEINPTNSDLQKSECLFEAFTSGPKGFINMIELSGKEAREEDVLRAFLIAQGEIDRVIEFQEAIIKEIGKPKAQVALSEVDAELRTAAQKFLEPRLKEAVYQKLKKEYAVKMAAIREAYLTHLKEGMPEKDLRAAEFLFDEAVGQLVHKNVLYGEARPDGRRLDEIRSLKAEIGIFTRTHGSAVFLRGNTQALAVATLAPPGAEQFIETMELTGRRRFLLHYNFPPYSVHEIGSFRGPGRREIGHGALAEKALRPLIPEKDAFPYTIRVVSEILSSNGSSSMATVSAASMALMDAGVPMKKAAAGIAMGLMMSERQEYKILTDIQGPEDHHGDMDFKVAGTRDGVTAIQLDVKLRGLTIPMIEEVLGRAKKARLEILDFTDTVIAQPRPEISSYAPAITVLKINPEKIGLVIGPGGKMINGLIRKYELTSIDIEEDGSVYVAGPVLEKVHEVVKEIETLTREFKVGDVVEGEVVRLLDFGAIVDLGGGQDGMVHVSELKNGYVKNVADVVQVGSFVRARVIRVDPDGKIGLSLKQLGS